VRKYWRTTGGRTKGKATEFTNQVRTFSTADEQTLWITFWNRKLYRRFAERRSRSCQTARASGECAVTWSSTDSLGGELLIENLSWCTHKGSRFPRNDLRCGPGGVSAEAFERESLPEVEETVTALGKLEDSVGRLVCRLGWKDFELHHRPDLCSGRAAKGGALGRTQKTVDLGAIDPSDREARLVQVKSQAGLDTFENYTRQFRAMPQYQEMFFVVHTPTTGFGRFDRRGSRSPGDRPSPGKASRVGWPCGLASAEGQVGCASRWRRA